MNELLEAVYVFLPAGIANATPPVLSRLLGPGRPIDGGLRWRGRPLFGAHKTWQGLIGGTAAGIATFLLQRSVDGLSLPIALGIAMSAGALLGDLLKSFVKRRLAVAAGRSWFPFDQLDYVAGALLAAAPFYPLNLPIIATITAVYFALHLAVSATGYWIGVKDAPV